MILYDFSPSTVTPTTSNRLVYTPINWLERYDEASQTVYTPTAWPEKYDEASPESSSGEGDEAIRDGRKIRVIR